MSSEDAKRLAAEYSGQVLKLNSGKAVRLGKLESPSPSSIHRLAVSKDGQRIEAAASLAETVRAGDDDDEEMRKRHEAAGPDDGAEEREGDQENGGEDEPRDFFMELYSGGIADVEFWGPMLFDLSSGDISSQRVPVLRQHDVNRVVGFSESIEMDERSGIKMGGKLLSGPSFPAAREVAAASDQGFPWQASAGLDADRMLFLDHDEEMAVNGQTFQGPLFVAKDWSLLEGSFVPLGADSNTSGVALSARVGSVMSVKESETDMADQNQATAQGERDKVLAHFGEKDAAFAIKAHREGWSFEESLIQYQTVIEAKAAEATEAAKIEAAQAQVAASAQPISSARDTDDTAERASVKYKRIFGELLAKGHNRVKATKIMARDHNDLRLAYIEEENQTRQRR